MARSAASNRWLKITAWTVGTLAILAVAGMLIGQAWMDRYIRSAEFRAEIEKRAGISLRAKITVEPLYFEGTRISSAGIEGQGATDAGFSKANVADLRGDVTMPSFLRILFGDRHVTLDNVEVQRATMEFYSTDRLELDLPPRPPRTGNVDVRGITVRDATVAWTGCGVTGTRLHAAMVEGGWKIEGSGGKLKGLWFRPMDVESAKVVFKEPFLYVQEAKLRHDGGEVIVTGELETKVKSDLRFQLNSVSLDTLMLPNDWLARLHGRLHGEVRAQFSLKKDRTLPLITAQVRIEKGVIEGLPVMNEFARFLQTEQLRRIELDEARGEIRYDGETLRVEKILLEKRQMIAWRAAFTLVRGDEFDCTYDLGLATSLIQKMPVLGEQIFTVQEGGYAWAKGHRITCKLSQPTTLRDTLVAEIAAKVPGAMIGEIAGTVVETVKNKAVEAVKDTAIEAAKTGVGTLLDILRGK